MQQTASALIVAIGIIAAPFVLGGVGYAQEEEEGCPETPTLGCTVNGQKNQPCIGTWGKDTITGTRGDDVILGLGGDDTIKGREGDDCLDGGPGNDRIDGDPGDDDIFDKSGNNTVNGGEGDDLIVTGYGDDRIEGDHGIDTIMDSGGTNTISGGECDDYIAGGHGNDRISGGDKDDTIIDLYGKNRIKGEVNNDTITTNAQSTVEGGFGCDTCTGGKPDPSCDGEICLPPGCENDCPDPGPQDCTSTPVEFCGDGIVNGNEQCDDGNNGDECDGCSSDCTFTECPQ